jgi:tetratricopeptide (TPR) repeat protein
MQDQARESLLKAESLMQNALRSSGGNRTALLKLAEISHDRMILADADRRNEEARALAGEASARLESFLGRGDSMESENSRAAQLFGNIALLYKNLHLYADSVRYARRSIEMSSASPSAQDYRANALSLIADSLRFSGDLDGALQTIRDARKDVEAQNSTDSLAVMTQRYNVLWREGVILGGDEQISLERSDEAVTSLQQAFDIIEEMAKGGPDDAFGRIRFASAGRELGNILRHRQPERALAVYNHALRRLREIKGNPRARRGEAELMACSSYVLRRLNRSSDARLQVDGALQILRETKDYPADRITLGDETETVLRAGADHLADTGEPQRAAEIYQELLDKVTASHPDPENDLRHATGLSRIYENLARLHRRNGNAELAQSISGSRVEIWQNWNRKLPQSTFVRKQFDAAVSR